MWMWITLFIPSVAHENQCVGENMLARLEKFDAAYSRKLINSVQKTARPRISLGSEEEVDHCNVRNQRIRYEVEIEALVSRICREVHLEDSDSALEDRVVSLVSSAQKVENVFKKRIHVATQACPDVVYSVSQTKPPLPTNKWTQYSYSVDVEDEIADQPALNFVQQQKERTEDFVEFSAAFNIFKNDYSSLIQEVRDTQTELTMEYKAHQSFVDVTYCKNKDISCASWHYAWEGIVAVAYVHQIYHSLQESETDFDEVTYKSFPYNVIVVWNIKQDLHPEMILSCPSEVFSLQFCPFDDNLIAAGCSNGQVVLWNIKKKICDESTTDEDVRGSCVSHIFVNWNNIIKRIQLTKPFKYSLPGTAHLACIVQLQWINDPWKITNEGKIGKKDYGTKQSQFITCSEDGLICVWILNGESDISGDTKSNPRKSFDKRNSACLKQKALLEMNLSPIYKLLTVDSYKNKLCPSAMAFYVAEERFQEDDALSESVCSPQFDEVPQNQPAEIWLGQFDGTVQVSSWKGVEFGTENKITEESITHIFSKNLHDGPVTCITPSPLMRGLMISVGGKIFAVWKIGSEAAPIFSTNSHQGLTYCSWSPTQPDVFFISNSDGSVEVWSLLLRSDKPAFCRDISGKTITGIYPTKINKSQNLLGMAVSNGVFRTFELTAEDKLEVVKVEDFSNFLCKQENVLKLFHTVQDEQREKSQLPVSPKLKDIVDLSVRDHHLLSLIQQRKLKPSTKGVVIKPTKLMTKEDKARQLWLKGQESHMERILLQKKNLNKRELFAKQELYLNVKNEKEKKFKKVERLRKDKNTILKAEESRVFPTQFNDPSTLTTSKEMDLAARLLKFGPKDSELLGYADGIITKSVEFEHKFVWSSIKGRGKKIRSAIDYGLLGHENK